MTPADRVRRLVASGSVAPEEGARLLEAMSAASPRSKLGLLVDPFERFGGGVSAAIGLAIAVFSVVLVTRTSVRFDGLFDLHITERGAASLRTALVEQLASWIVPAILFWIYARVLSRHVRLIDFVGMTGLARWPLLLGALVLLPVVPGVASARAGETLSPALLVTLVVAVGCVVLDVVLLYKGFKNASGLTGTKLVAGFIGLALLGEIVSKVVLSALS
jgi:cytochrome c oxidase subunit IV